MRGVAEIQPGDIILQDFGVHVADEQTIQKVQLRKLIELYPNQIYVKIKSNHIVHIEELSLDSMQDNEKYPLMSLMGVYIGRKFETLKACVGNRLTIYRPQGAQFRLKCFYVQKLLGNNVDINEYNQYIVGAQTRTESNGLMNILRMDEFNNVYFVSEQMLIDKYEQNKVYIDDGYKQLIRSKNKKEAQAVKKKREAERIKNQKKIEREKLKEERKQAEKIKAAAEKREKQRVDMVQRAESLELDTQEIQEICNVKELLDNSKIAVAHRQLNQLVEQKIGRQLKLEYETDSLFRHGALNEYIYRYICEVLMDDRFIRAQKWMPNRLYDAVVVYNKSIPDSEIIKLQRLVEINIETFSQIARALNYSRRNVVIVGSNKGQHIYRVQVTYKHNPNDQIMSQLIKSGKLNYCNSSDLIQGQVLKEIWRNRQPFRHGDIFIQNQKYFVLDMRSSEYGTLREVTEQQLFGAYNLKKLKVEQLVKFSIGNITQILNKNIQIDIDMKDQDTVKIIRLCKKDGKICCVWCADAIQIIQLKNGQSAIQILKNIQQYHQVEGHSILRNRKKLQDAGVQSDEIMVLDSVVQKMFDVQFSRQRDSDTRYFDFITVEVPLIKHQELLGGGEYDKTLENLSSLTPIIDNVVIKYVTQQKKFKDSGITMNMLSCNRVLTRDMRLVYKFDFKKELVDAVKSQ